MRAIDLSHQDAHDASAVGHKAATLARFAATFRVPPAFCLATTVYEELRGALDGDAVARVELGRLVSEAYARLAAQVGTEEPAVAVRSSAIGEDSADASFAGQHETILDVRGADAVTDAVLECWRSAGNERVTAYRREKGIDEPARIAVLVQQMVPSDVSAIAFGVDPVSGDHEVVVIDAAHGLGDKIASGDITPDRYAVRKADLLVTGPVRGALDDNAAREVAKLVLALERANEHAVDVECAFANGELYLLQCRPITTLASFPVTWAHPDDAKLHWRRDDAHFGEPAPRLVTDTSRLSAAVGLQRRAEIFDLPMRPRFEAFGGRMYNTAERRVTGGDLAMLARGGVARVRADARGARRRWDEEYLPALRAHYAWLEEKTAAIGRVPRGELAAMWNDVWRRAGDIWVIHMFTVHAAFAAGDELAEAYERLVGGRSVDGFKLVQGRADTLQQLERDLAALAKHRASGDEAALAEAMRAFLATPHGNLGNSGEDLRLPSWRDDPALLVAELDRRLARPVEEPDVRRARLVADGDAVERQALEALRDRPADRARFVEILATARAVSPLTEEHNYHLDRQFQSIMRRLFLALGTRMVADGQIAEPSDIYHFAVSEISDALGDGRALHELTRERTAELAGWRRLRHPPTLGAAGGPIAPMSSRVDLIYRQQQDEAGVIKGVAASGGVRRARVCLVRGAHEFSKFAAGQVLVCRSSNVSWIPLFTAAAAVVTDVGGSLSHAAVVAREFGVPAVVGCGVALDRLQDGQLVEVDGDRGYVRPLD